MKLSVIVPCYNAEPYLAQTIGSALDQTRPPHEIIVIDDGSSDGSLALAHRFQASLPGRVRVLSERSGRASRTRNLGALIATGDAIMFLDADDVLGPDTLEALANTLAQQPGGVAVCPWFRLKHIDWRWVKQAPSCPRRLPGQDALSAWLTGWYHPPCSVLWSRTAFEQAGRWDEQAAVNQDGDLMMRALARGFPLVETSSGTAYYRRRPEGEGSLSGTRFTRHGVTARIRIVKKIAFVLEQRGQLEKYRPAIKNAFSLIARAAPGGHPDLSDQASTLARQYGPPVWARAKRQAGSLIWSGQRAAGAPWPPFDARRGRARAEPAEPNQLEEVRCGLDRAEQVLSERPLPPSAAATGAEQLGLPSVTVIIPTHNRAYVLPRALDSVLAQTYPDFEILIVDDGSTDGTEAVVAAYADPRVRYLRRPQNGGVSAARNRGLREARGEFVAFLDSDDEWLPEKVSMQVALFRSLPDEVGLIYTGVESVREDGSTRVKCSRDRGNVYREMLARNVIHGGGSNVMIRREVVATVGFFHEELPAIEDYEYWLRIARFFDVDFIEKPLIRYHDPQAAERRSTALQANLDARWWLYRQYATEMRRAGVAHLFLLKCVRWAFSSPQRNVWTARRLALRAVLEAPASRMAVATLIRTVLPGAGRVRWIRRHAVLE